MSDPAAFITRWAASGASERANYVLFLSELCDLLGVPRPDPTKPDDTDNAYVFERNVTFQHADGSTSTGRIDLYKRACFILEAKQGVEKREAETALSESAKAKARTGKKGHGQRGSAAWDVMMLRAFGQAESYARALPASEGRPPLLIVVDVGHSLELYAEFTRTGGVYIPFPDPRSHRIRLERLADPAVRDTLRLAWTDPQALDPARRSARVTRDIAEKLGRLAASLEKSGHAPEAVATFLMRALFTMFAEDVELLPKDGFASLLKSLQGHTGQFVPMIEELWSRMQTGGFSTVLREHIRHFNGGLFAHAAALPLTPDQFALLTEAAHADWRDVEPAIFGTLLERALDPHERHKLGAHYTPRAYVERLVLPTVVQPLRAEWDAVKAAALTLDRAGKTQDAAAEVQRFHRRLCEVRVLDPACGSGNFLYVTLEHLKRLEGEVLDALDALGHAQATLEMAGFSVDPHQLLGLEINPRAAAIAELVLWIGHLQWHFRTRGRVAPPEPIIKAFHNIECRDAVLTCDSATPLLDDTGAPVTRWDGRTTKPHPVTGAEVPDDTARVPLLAYQNPRPAAWPQADFIIGNPPFIGNKRMRAVLGDGYTETLRAAYPDVPETADFVMYWWHKAATLVRQGHTARFGLITTNSLTQTFNRRVLEHHLSGKPLSQEPDTTASVPDKPISVPDKPTSVPDKPISVTDKPISVTDKPISVTDKPISVTDKPTSVTDKHASVTDKPTSVTDKPTSVTDKPTSVTDANASESLKINDQGPESPSGTPKTENPRPTRPPAAPTAAPPLSLRFAIPDHPWVDSAEGAAVRIAMTLGAAGQADGQLVEVVDEIVHGEDAAEVTLKESKGLIHANITVGANVAATADLRSNQRLSNQGMTPLGTGFRLTPDEVEEHVKQNPESTGVLRPYAIGRDIVQVPEPKFIIDLFGLSEEEARTRFPALYQHLLVTVKPERDQKERDVYRIKWWVFAEPRANLRPALAGLSRYIATCRTAKHRIFTFLPGTVLPDAKIVAIALEDPFHLGVLSSRIHSVWAYSTGSWLGVGNDSNYNHSDCFGKFPFPEATDAQRGRIRELAERLDAHRKRQQALHPKLTLTDCYNVLEKLRAGAALTPKEQTTHEHGLVSVLRQLHDDLDAAVLDAYGWAGLAPAPAPPGSAGRATMSVDDAILARLCALNTQRAAEEQRGQVRWLRPEFQMRDSECGMRNEQTALEMPEHPSGTPRSALPGPKSKQPWPKPLPERVRAVAAALTAAPRAAAAVAARFKAAKAAEVEEILDTLVLMGQAREDAAGYALK